MAVTDKTVVVPMRIVDPAQMSFVDHLRAIFLGGDSGYGPLANSVIGLFREILIFAALIIGGNIVRNYQAGQPIFTQVFFLNQLQLLLYVALQFGWRFMRSKNSVIAGLLRQLAETTAKNVTAEGEVVPVVPDQPVATPAPVQQPPVTNPSVQQARVGIQQPPVAPPSVPQQQPPVSQEKPSTMPPPLEIPPSQ